MNKRYYYSCPLKAAYMAKYFLMSFDLSQDKFRGWATEIQLPVERYYIHPDCVSMLEPKEKDVFLEKWYDNPVIVVSDEEYKDIKADGFEDRYISISQASRALFNPPPPESIYGYDTRKEPNIFDRSSIAQRNGIAFMWPESEEV